MSTAADIQELVNRAKENDLQALSQLYELFFNRVYRYIFVRVQNKEEAEDLTSQVFLKMVENIGKFSWQGFSFSAWLFKIAHNLVVDWYRSKPAKEAEKQAEPAPKSDPEDLVLLNEKISMALKSLRNLSEQQREVLILRLLGGLSCQQTAQVLGLSEGNVRLIQHRALTKLREELKVKTDV